MMPKIRIEEVFQALPDAADLDKPQAIIEQWGTSMHLCKVCRMSKSAVTNNLARLYADKRAHVADWVPPVKGGQTAGIWVKGPGKNAPRRTADHDEAVALKRRTDRLSRAKAKHDAAQVGQGRAISHGTIERTMAAGPRSWLAALEDVQKD